MKRDSFYTLFKPFCAIIDVVVFIPALLIFAALLVVTLIVGSVWRLFKKKPMAPVQLTLLSGSIDANAKRNINCVYDASSLNGYFKHCFFVYYLADKAHSEEHNAEVSLIDFRSAFATGVRSLGLRLTSYLLQEALLLIYLYELILRKKITVIQVNDPYIQGVHGYLLSRMTGIPFVVRVMCDYDHYYEKFGRLAFPVLRWRRIEKSLDHLILKKADAVIPWTENYARYATANGAKRERTVILPALTDPRYFVLPVESKKQAIKMDSGKNPILIYLGRLSWDKYCLDLVDCMAELVRDFPNAQLVILGNGELREEFVAKARQNEVAENIQLAGVQNVEQIIAWANVANVMLAPHAGFSLVELGAVGLPVVAYDYEWHSELVKNGETGFLVPFREPRAMAAAAKRILQDKKLAQAMSERLRSLTHTQYHPEIVKKKMAEFFSGLASKNVNARTLTPHAPNQRQTQS